jgi:ElaB/YqjD/DUF883 family membrane-anchored ribosome-binding protein
MDDREREAYPGPSDRAWTQATATSTPGNSTTTGRSGAVGKAVETAGGLAMDAVEKTREKVAEYRDKGFEQVSRDVAEYTRSQPVPALLIAGGVGMVVGLLLGLGRR